MASSSQFVFTKENEGPQEELERFDDFTLASSWERFISEIEAILRLWLASDSKKLMEKAVHLGFSGSIYKVSFELKYAGKKYSLQYHFETCDQAADWICTLHDLQLSFGVNDFLVIAPQSANGVVLDGPEASKLLSAVAIAMSNCSCLWPAFVPVHDPSRKAYIGIQNMGTVFTRRFEADRIGSQVPVKLMHLEGLYELFVSKFAFSVLDFSRHLVKVHFTMKLTYCKLSYDDDDDNDDVTAQPNVKDSNRNTQWDDDCPWSEWYSAEDPVRGFDLVVVWLEEMVDSSLEMAELENASPLEAGKWFLVPNLSPYLDEADGKTVGFASQLRCLVDALNASSGAQFLEDFVSVENSSSENFESSTVIPPPTVLDRLLKDVFHEAKLTGFPRGMHKNSQMIKGAPLDSLFAQFCLHSLWFGNCNIRAVAVLWIEFVREVRWCWEESQPLPRMLDCGVIDLSTCLVNQKLQMLAICIEKKCKSNHNVPINNTKSISSVVSDAQLVEEQFHVQTPLSDTNLTNDRFDAYVVSDVSINSDNIRRGSAGVVGSMMLLTSHQNMHAPLTQDPPIMTEDMHEERLQAVEAFGDTINFSAHLERDVLCSDMSAFKAANPDAVFEDFIRWHSPGDWIDDVKDSEESSSHSMETFRMNWPPQGRLSQRMSENGNLWIKIWNDAPALPASEQKLILDPNREGEKILHYLETLRPYHLLQQMICTAFRAAADTLNLTNFGASNQMNTKLAQLYLTISSVLKPLQGSSISEESEIFVDLKRLCSVFQHIERLLTVAASFHRKFLLSPRLSESFFTDFYNFYLPRMGTGSIQSKQFDSNQAVTMDERSSVSNLFTPPSANQSWRKVLSMGNLLNGHEPMVREIIFRTRDKFDGTHYAEPAAPMVEPHRMYICSTSNDLRVALSITTCD